MLIFEKTPQSYDVVSCRGEGKEYIIILLIINLSLYPLSFVRGGYVYPWYGSTRDLGIHGLYWSSTAYPTASTAYGQHFNSANVFPSTNTYRAYGFSVRFVM